MKILTLSLLLIIVAQPWAYACEDCSGSNACEMPSTLVPSGCTLSAAALPERLTEIGALFSLREEVRELDKGFAFRFPGDDNNLATRLASLIIAERQCCSFFEFELSFAVENGPIWLTVNGSQEAKTFLASLLGSSAEKPEGR